VKASPTTPALILRACPHCGGDLAIDESKHWVGTTYDCMMCGRGYPLEILRTQVPAPVLANV
jgi:hypothetical protein